MRRQQPARQAAPSGAGPASSTGAESDADAAAETSSTASEPEGAAGSGASSADRDASPNDEPTHGAPRQRDDQGRTTPLSAQRYKIELTGSAKLVDQLERVRALMRHRAPGAGLEVVLSAALELLEAKLLAERFSAGVKPRRTTKPQDSRKTTRHVPRSVRREVFLRDGLRCTFVDPRTGRRCSERAVEFQHHEPFSVGGAHDASNVSLFCANHNRFAARRDFGREHIEAAINRRREEQRAKRAPDEAPQSRPPPATPQVEATQLLMFAG